MRRVQPDIRRVIEDFGHAERLKSKAIEAVVLCGSYATGKATARSDIDLCYMGQFPGFNREYRAFRNHAIQLMIAPWDWYREVIASYERKSNVGTITSMLAEGICVWSSTNDWDTLQQEVLKYYRLGPTPATHEEIIRIRRRLTELWNNFTDSNHELDAVWLKNNILQYCVEAQFVIKSWWAVKPKYQMQEIHRRDLRLFTYVEKCLIATTNAKQLQDLCEYVLAPIGGWMKEGSTDD